MASDYGMISIPYQDCISIAHSQRAVAAPIPCIEPLVSIPFWAIDSVIVDLIEINFGRRIVNVMFMGWIAGPVPARRINLDDHQLIRGKVWRHDIDNLP